MPNKHLEKMYEKQAENTSDNSVLRLKYIAGCKIGSNKTSLGFLQIEKDARN